MRSTVRGVLAGGFAAIAAAVMPAAASETANDGAATVVRAAVDLPADHPLVAEGWKAFAEAAEAESRGTLEFRVFVNGAVVGSARSLEGLSRGEVDMGFLAPASYPDSFPRATFLTDLAMIGEDGVAAAAAMTELILLHCPACRDEYREQNMVFLGTYSSAPYVLIAKNLLADVESLKMRRVRTPGSLWDRWVRATGAFPAANGMEPGEALESGAADAVVDTVLSLQDPKLWHAANAVVTVPLGAYRGASAFTVNRNYWAELTDEQRAALLGAAPAGVVTTTLAYAQQAAYVLDVSRERGLDVREPEPSLRTAVDAFVNGDDMLASDAAILTGGHEQAASIADTYRALYGKYVALLEPLQAPAEKISVIGREIYGKLDPATFGREAEIELGTTAEPDDSVGGGVTN